MCNKCNNSCNECPCTCQNNCSRPQCECAIKLNSDCITVKDGTFTCSGIADGLTLTAFLEAFDTFVCDKFDLTTSFFTLLNLGTGAEVYAGVNGVGSKLFRTLLGSNLVNVVQGVNEITISIDEDALSEFVNQKQITSVDGSIVIIETDTTIDLSVLTIEDAIPRFIVNSAYTGTEELGTVPKPFKTIQAALTAFVGNTLDANNPQFAGASIIIQQGSGYTFTGNFNYANLNIIIEDNTFISSNPTTGNYLCNYDLITNNSAKLNIIVGSNSTISLEKGGFKNGGSAITALNYINGKTINISGTGQIFQSSTVNFGSAILDYPVVESNYTNTLNLLNDGLRTFSITCLLASRGQSPIYRIGGDSLVFFSDTTIITSNLGENINPVLKSLDQTGGDVRLSNCNILFLGSAVSKLFTLSKFSSFICSLQIRNTQFSGNCVDLFSNITATQSYLDVANVITSSFTCTNVFTSALVVWQPLFRNNIVGAGTLNSQVDLTRGNTTSVSNTIFANVIDNLQRFTSRTSAAISLLPGTKFINTNSHAINTTPAADWFIDMVM